MPDDCPWQDWVLSHGVLDSDLVLSNANFRSTVRYARASSGRCRIALNTDVSLISSVRRMPCLLGRWRTQFELVQLKIDNVEKYVASLGVKDVSDIEFYSLTRRLFI